LLDVNTGMYSFGLWTRVCLSLN